MYRSVHVSQIMAKCYVSQIGQWFLQILGTSSGYKTRVKPMIKMMSIVPLPEAPVKISTEALVKYVLLHKQGMGIEMQNIFLYICTIYFLPCIRNPRFNISFASLQITAVFSLRR